MPSRQLFTVEIHSFALMYNHGEASSSIPLELSKLLNSHFFKEHLISEKMSPM